MRRHRPTSRSDVMMRDLADLVEIEVELSSIANGVDRR
jgi:hypothetical protein